VVGDRPDGKDCRGTFPHGIDKVGSHLFDAFHELENIRINGKSEKKNTYQVRKEC
jgi:hypothetical protein